MKKLLRRRKNTKTHARPTRRPSTSSRTPCKPTTSLELRPVRTLPLCRWPPRSACLSPDLTPYLLLIPQEHARAALQTLQTSAEQIQRQLQRLERAHSAPASQSSEMNRPSQAEVTRTTNLARSAIAALTKETPLVREREKSWSQSRCAPQRARTAQPDCRRPELHIIVTYTHMGDHPPPLQAQNGKDTREHHVSYTKYAQARLCALQTRSQDRSRASLITLLTRHIILT